MKPRLAEDRLRRALAEIRSNAHNDDWAERYALCDDQFHVCRHADSEFCPQCYSSWWDINGAPPCADTAPRYAVEAIARGALAEADAVREAIGCRGRIDVSSEENRQ